MKFRAKTMPCWPEAIEKFPSLTQNIQADVCIVGGGITGLLCAYELGKQKKSVILIDKGDVASGETRRTTAHLTSLLDSRIYELIKTFSKEKVSLLINSHQMAINYYRDLIASENIHCDLANVNAYLFSSDRMLLKKELEGYKSIGFNDLEIKARLEQNAFMSGPSLMLPNQARLNPHKLIHGLLKKLRDFDVQIYARTAAHSFKKGPSPQIKTDGGAIIHAQDIIVATDTPINDRVFIILSKPHIEVML